MEFDAVTPIAGKIISRSEIYLVEYRAITHDNASNFTGLRQMGDGIYSLEPPDPGTGR